MNKLALLAVASLAIVGGASAQVKAKSAKAPKEISCAVMKGDMTNIAKATKAGSFADYKGRRYFFCCAHCIGQFKAEPAKFAKAPSIPTPKKKA